MNWKKLIGIVATLGLGYLVYISFVKGKKVINKCGKTPEHGWTDKYGHPCLGCEDIYNMLDTWGMDAKFWITYYDEEGRQLSGLFTGEEIAFMVVKGVCIHSMSYRGN